MMGDAIKTSMAAQNDNFQVQKLPEHPNF